MLKAAGNSSEYEENSPEQVLVFFFVQEQRRAERAEQQRIRSEQEKERQARLAVRIPHDHVTQCFWYPISMRASLTECHRIQIIES